MFCILIPTINRKDLLCEALDYYTSSMPNTELFVLDNGNQDIPSYPKTWVLKSPYNLGVAASWNTLIGVAISRGYVNFLILNDDVILKCGEAKINEIIDKGEEEGAFHRCRPFYNWSAFILRKSILDKVGIFDENFRRCYFEDNDYQYRMQLQKVPIRYEDDLAPAVYRNSQSIEKQPLLNNYVGNRAYYVKKWGGIPEQETYKTPFNI